MFVFRFWSFQLAALREKYIKIEFDPNMSIEEKVPHMEQWFVCAFGVFNYGDYLQVAGRT
jgi:hypothetical protein